MSKGKMVVLTARRSDDMSVSLRKRRRWYSDDSDEVEKQQGDVPSATQGSADEEIAAMKSELAKLKREAAERRVAAKEAEEALAAERTKHLEEQGDWKRLAEERQAEVKRLQAIEQRHNEFVEAQRAENEARLQQIPEHNRVLIPAADMSPERLSQYLTTHWARLTASGVPSTDAGATGPGRKHKSNISDRDRQAASIASLHGRNIDPEAIARRREAQQNQSQNETNE